MVLKFMLYAFKRSEHTYAESKKTISLVKTHEFHHACDAVQ